MEPLLRGRGSLTNMSMKNRIATLKEKYSQATTKAELAQIEREMNALAAEDNDSFSRAMVELAGETVAKADELILREQLKDVIPIVSLAYIAKTYFNKTRQWLYQRINGSLVNGKPARFTPEEIETLNNALKDIGNRLSSINVSA